MVERRGTERRARADRRASADGAHRADAERRLIRSVAGRRAGERRTLAVPVQTPDLPRRARPFAERLLFFERLEPTTQATEDLDTARLVMAFQSGDRGCFSVLYERYFDRVYGYLRTFLRQGGDAEDAAQQVFLQVFEALPRFELRQRPFRSWLFTIARNHALKRLAVRTRLEPVDPIELGRHRDSAAEPDPELPVLGWLSDRELLLFVERLPLAQRQVLLLRYMHDMSFAEIATVIGRTPEDARGLHHRALLFLRERLTALGRAPAENGPRRGRLVRCHKQAPVLRMRRFALYS